MFKLILTLVFVAPRVLPMAGSEPAHIQIEGYDTDAEAPFASITMVDGSVLMGWVGGTCKSDICWRAFERTADGAYELTVWHGYAHDLGVGDR